MFDAVRNNKKIVQIFLALITLPFAFFGVDSYVRNAGTGDEVAKIGDVKITPAAVPAGRARAAGALAGADGGSVDPKMLDTPGSTQGDTR